MRLPVRLLGAVAALAAAIAPLTASEPPADLAGYRTVHTAVTVTPRFRSGEHRPGYLGICAEPDPAGGLRIAAVEPDSPAANAGLKVGDRLQMIGHQTFADLNALRSFLLECQEGEPWIVRVLRDGRPVLVTVTLASPSRPLSPDPVVLGIQMSTVAQGVRIDRVSPGMPAAQAGVKAGDVLLRVGRDAITNQDVLREVLGGHRAGETVKLALLREGKELALEARLVADPYARRTFDERPSLARWDDQRADVWRRDIYRLAVVPIAFADTRFNEKVPPTEWEKALFSTGVYTDKSATGQPVYGSLNDYYREISCGHFQLTGKVFAPVTAAKKRSEYAAMPNRFALLTEALDLLTARDGRDALAGFDGLFFLYAGGRVMTQRGGVFWPHRASLGYHGGRWAYFICPEGGERMGSISVISHEFGHMLGLPDLYAQADAPGSPGLGVWCTMSTGHGYDGKPLHFSAWCKEQLGWLKPCVIDPTVKQKLVLAPVEGSPAECYKVLVRPDGSEYLLLENRVRQGFDRDLPGEGLLIWRVVDGKPVLEEAHGAGGPGGPTRFLGSVPYPSRSNRAFTPSTTPSSRPVKLGGQPVHITNIRRLPDGRITFHIGYEYL